MSTACLSEFTALDSRFWVTLTMHYSEKSSQVIDCIVSEGLNPSQRINGLMFNRQIGNLYVLGHPSINLLEDFRHQFINMPEDMDIFQSYFEQAKVPDLSTAAGSALSLCFSHPQVMYSTMQISYPWFPRL